jgi:hypothetical protein
VYNGSNHFEILSYFFSCFMAAIFSWTIGCCVLNYGESFSHYCQLNTKLHSQIKILSFYNFNYDKCIIQISELKVSSQRELKFRNIRRFSDSSISKEHLMGPYMSVIFFSIMGMGILLLEITCTAVASMLHNNMTEDKVNTWMTKATVGRHCCPARVWNHISATMTWDNSTRIA